MSPIRTTAGLCAPAVRPLSEQTRKRFAITASFVGMMLAGVAQAGGRDYNRSLHDAYQYDAEASEEIAAAAGGVMTATEKQTALNLINAARSKSRMCGSRAYAAAAPVQWNLLLEQAAQRHSDDMASRNWFSHTGTDGSSPATRISATGYRWYTLGENIAAGYSTVQSVVDGWLKSPGHCANIMNSRFKEIGMARQINAASRYGSYWTLDLAASR